MKIRIIISGNAGNANFNGIIMPILDNPTLVCKFI
jgi:hypothetical protein